MRRRRKIQWASVVTGGSGLYLFFNKIDMLVGHLTFWDNFTDKVLPMLTLEHVAWLCFLGGIATLVWVNFHRQIRAMLGLSEAPYAEVEEVGTAGLPAVTAELARIAALEARLADAEAGVRDLPRLWEAADRLGRGQVEHERAFGAHLNDYKEFARWTDARLGRLIGLFMRAERRKRLSDYKDEIEKISSQITSNSDVQAAFGIDRLRQIAEKVELLFEVHGIRSELATILESWDRDCRAGRVKEDEARWLLFQSQRDALIQTISKLERRSFDEDYEANDAMLTHR